MQNSSGSFSLKTPHHTNPANYSLPDRQPIDQLLNPIVTGEDLENRNLQNLYTSNMSQFKNTSYDIGWRYEKLMAEHSNFHVTNKTFGDSNTIEGYEKLLNHQTLMYNGILAGMSFLESHKYALEKGPKVVNIPKKKEIFI